MMELFNVFSKISSKKVPKIVFFLLHPSTRKVKMNVQKWRWDLKVVFHLKQKDFEIFPIEVVNIEYMPFFFTHSSRKSPNGKQSAQELAYCLRNVKKSTKIPVRTAYRIQYLWTSKEHPLMYSVSEYKV